MTKSSGPMVAEITIGKYLVELCGDNAKVWVGYGLPQYEGSIDGIEQMYPELWNELIAKKFIKPV